MKESAKSRATFMLLAGLARPLMNVLMARKWEGVENLPPGGFIAVPNHCTEIDPIVIGHMVYNQKRPPHFLAKTGLFKVPVLGALLHATKQIPVERSTAGANRSLQVAKEVVDAGGAIIIYPRHSHARSRFVAHEGPYRGRQASPADRSPCGAHGALGGCTRGFPTVCEAVPYLPAENRPSAYWEAR